MRTRLTNKEKKLLELLKFKIEHPDELDIHYVQYTKYFNHPFIQGLHLMIDGSINIYAKEDKLGISGHHVLLSVRKLTKKNLFKTINQLISI